MVTVAEACCVGSAKAVAVMVAVPVAPAAGVKRPEFEMVPMEVGATDQRTAGLRTP
jgi:hypothetical protein